MIYILFGLGVGIAFILGYIYGHQKTLQFNTKVLAVILARCSMETRKEFKEVTQKTKLELEDLKNEI